jgi:hypothetical protein
MGHFCPSIHVLVVLAKDEIALAQRRSSKVDLIFIWGWDVREALAEASAPKLPTNTKDFAKQTILRYRIGEVVLHPPKSNARRGLMGVVNTLRAPTRISQWNLF